jgi:hypothetical protein
VKIRVAVLAAVAVAAASALWGVMQIVESRNDARAKVARLSERVFTPVSEGVALRAAFSDAKALRVQEHTIVWCDKKNPTSCMAEGDLLLYASSEDELVDLRSELAKVAVRMSMECFRAQARDGSWSAGYCLFEPAPWKGKEPKA